MINIKLTIEYEGTRYCGWQKQKDLPSIQGILENKISQITQEKISLCGSGRTDAGVHALGQVANFRTCCTTIPCKRLPLILNRLLPSDIRIKKAEIVEDNFHARYSALSKIYHYYILNNYESGYTPFLLRNYIYCVYRKIDLEKIRKAISFLYGEHDFSSFACTGSSIKNTVRTIKRAEVINKGNIICFHFEANAFLYKMVRTMVGTLLDVGYGKIDYLDVKKILEAKDRKMAGRVVPAKGLFLMKVNYQLTN